MCVGVNVYGCGGWSVGGRWMLEERVWMLDENGGGGMDVGRVRVWRYMCAWLGK